MDGIPGRFRKTGGGGVFGEFDGRAVGEAASAAFATFRVAPYPSSDLNSANFDPLCIPVMVSSFPIEGIVDSETNGLAVTELQ